MFKFKKDFSEFKKDVDVYVDNLDLEDALKNMNILPKYDISKQEMSIEIESNYKNTNINFHISVENKEVTETNKLNTDAIKNNDISKAA